jgi:hypothetical protein
MKTLAASDDIEDLRASRLFRSTNLTATGTHAVPDIARIRGTNQSVPRNTSRRVLLLAPTSRNPSCMHYMEEKNRLAFFS